jgi:hypothetical protein
MGYKINTETSEIIEYSDKTHGRAFREEPWIDATEQQYNDFEKEKKLKDCKEKKKKELREDFINNALQSSFDSVDNCTTEEEVDNINIIGE